MSFRAQDIDMFKKCAVVSVLTCLLAGTSVGAMVVGLRMSLHNRLAEMSTILARLETAFSERLWPDGTLVQFAHKIKVPLPLIYAEQDDWNHDNVDANASECPSNPI